MSKPLKHTRVIKDLAEALLYYVRMVQRGGDPISRGYPLYVQMQLTSLDTYRAMRYFDVIPPTRNFFIMEKGVNERLLLLANTLRPHMLNPKLQKGGSKGVAQRLLDTVWWYDRLRTETDSQVQEAIMKVMAKRKAKGAQ